MSQLIKFVYRIYGVGILSLLFFSYPFALIPPGLSSNSYYLQLPTLFILSIISLILIGCTCYKVTRSASACLIIYCTFIVLNLYYGSDRLKEIIEFLSFITIPLAFCLYIQKKSNNMSIIAIPASTLYLLLLIYGFINFFLEQEVIGITGNRNWMATALISLCPWAMYILNQFMTRLFKNDQVNNGLSVTIILVPTLFLVFHCQSRATWLCLISFLIISMIYLIRLLFLRILVILSIIACCSVAIIAYPNPLINALKGDIRIPTWVSTAKLISDYPLKGTGAGNYTKMHTPYRAKSEYHSRSVATNLTTHPHNEFLNIGANLGIIAAIAWSILLIPIVLSWHGKLLLFRLSQFSAFMVYGHSMLDKTLIQSPTNIIGLCSLGVLWQLFITYKEEKPIWIRHLILRFVVTGFFAIIVIYSIQTVSKDVHIGLRFRQITIAKYEKNYDRMFQLYKDITKIDPTNIKGYYGAGTVAVQKLLHPEIAIPYLQKAFQIDPNYAHINRLIGKAYGTLKDHSTALSYFERECRIFPSDISAFQNYFIALFKTNKIDRLTRVDDFLRGLYLQKSAGRTPLTDQKKISELWLSALKESNTKLTIKCADQMTESLPTKFIDPLLSHSRTISLPSSYIFDRYNSHDFDYWREILARDQIIRKLGLTDSAHVADEISQLNTLINYLLQNQTISTRHIPNIMYPTEMLQLKQTNIQYFFALLSWINEGMGYQTFCFKHNNSSLDNFIMVVGQHGMYKVGIHYLDENRLIINFADEFNFQELSNPKFYSITLFVLPQSFLLKNQILSILLNQHTGNTNLKFATVPTLQLIKKVKLFRQFGIGLDRDNIFMGFPFQILNARLSAN